MEKRNKLLPTSMLELLFEPLSGNGGGKTLFVSPHGNLVRKFYREEITHQVTQLARGMAATNLKRGCRVGMICRNSVKANIAAMANLLNGYVNVVLPLGASLEEKLKALASSRAECLIVDSIDSAMPLLENIRNLPQLRQIITLDEARLPKTPEILCTNWTMVLERASGQPDRTALLRQAITADQEAFLYFMPDELGQLRGSVRTHRQLLSAAAELRDSLPESLATLHSKHRMLAILPFASAEAFALCSVLPLMMEHSCMVLDVSEDWKIEGLAARDALVIAESGFFEKLHGKLHAKIAEQGGWRLKLWSALFAEGTLKNKLLAALGGFVFRPLIKAHLAGRMLGAVAVCRENDTAIGILFQSLNIPFRTVISEQQEMLEARSLAEC